MVFSHSARHIKIRAKVVEKLRIKANLYGNFRTIENKKFEPAIYYLVTDCKMATKPIVLRLFHFLFVSAGKTSTRNSIFELKHSIVVFLPY